MLSDDDDSTSASRKAAARATDSDAFSENDGDEQVPDFRFFAALGASSQKPASGRTIRRGEKDFESHGTRAQEGVLESSRSAMHDVLSYTRQSLPRNVLRGWYFPDRWADMPDDTQSTGNMPKTNARSSSYPMFARERVVAIEVERGTLLTSMGRIVTGVEKNTPGWQKLWLLPEEALFLVERGSLDLWWPSRGIEDVFPVKDEESDDLPNESSHDVYGKSLEEHELGVPVGLQGAYALLIGRDGEPGKVSLEKFQVYAGLKRTGYSVLRATPLEPPSPPSPQPLWHQLYSLISNSFTNSQSQLDQSHCGPLLKPGLYRSYTPIFEQLALIPRHKPTQYVPADYPEPQEPYKVHYHIWKAQSVFTKVRPPPPDFRLCVVDARETNIPTLEQIDALLMSTPFDPPLERDRDVKGAGFVYKRLKHGWRNVLVAVVDRGMISYLNFGEMAFGEEKLYENSDMKPRSKRGRGAGRGGAKRGRGRGR
ncbi:hypothetical protein GGR57DRAFT_359753 [Xylariaceae sp. FL1272]|nr:hypothetical protein GGR57DRAFT_359753 [Xylariaceae sp. FL1272]